MSFEFFYRNQQTEFDELAESVVTRLYNSDENVLEQLSRNDTFASVALPNRHSIDAGTDISLLWTNVQMTKRYMELVLGILHRMSCRLVTLAPRPSFVFERERLERAECTIYELLTGKHDERKGLLRSLLDAVLRSLSVVGFLDITMDIYNSLYRVFQTEKGISASDWAAEQIAELGEDFCFVEEAKKDGPSNEEKSSAYKKLAPKIAEPRKHIRLEVPRVVPFCEHGIYMRPHVNKGRNRFVCWLIAWNSKCVHACQKSIPISNA